MALVPPGVVTVTSTAPALPAGEVAVICVALLTVNEAAAVTAELHRRGAGEVGAGDGDRRAARRRPAVRADAGDRRGRRHVGELVGGAGGAGAARRRDGDVHRAGAAGRRRRRDLVALLTVNEVAAVPPNFTAVAPVKLVPVMVTDGAAGRRAACSGATPVTVGAGVT